MLWSTIESNLDLEPDIKIMGHNVIIQEARKASYTSHRFSEG